MVHPAAVSHRFGQQSLAVSCPLRRSAGATLAVLLLALCPLFYAALCTPRRLHQLPLIRQPVDIAAPASALAANATTVPASANQGLADRQDGNGPPDRTARIMPDDYPQPSTFSPPATELR